MTDNPLILPMFSHIALCAFLYVLLTIARAPKVWGLWQMNDGSNPWHACETRITNNLKNQFEWPLFFYIACVLLLAEGDAVSQLQCYLAWAFVAGRVLHSIIQIGTRNIRLRGIVFTINFLAVLAMWTDMVYQTL
ncbi:hypothetical protein NBRC116587_13290 [Pseudoteredinibacter isoporae]